MNAFDSGFFYKHRQQRISIPFKRELTYYIILVIYIAESVHRMVRHDTCIYMIYLNLDNLYTVILNSSSHVSHTCRDFSVISDSLIRQCSNGAIEHNMTYRDLMYIVSIFMVYCGVNICMYNI